MQLSTIGYEGASLTDFIETLSAQGVRRVVDIRELPQSRRPGFSKRVLSEALAAAGIEYEHRKLLGDPKSGRDAARAGDYPKFRVIYSAHLERPDVMEALKDVLAVARAEHCALLCYERDPKQCHRTLVTDQLVRLHPFKVKHLGVQPKKHGSRGIDDGIERYAGAL